MVQAMNEAREAAAAGSPEYLRDWFDGEVFRKLVAQGYFSSNTCIALSIPTVFKHGGSEVSKDGRLSRRY